MRLKIVFSSVLATLLMVGGVYAQRMTREEYIQKYKKLALEHQDVYGIPASIKMAQALCESDNGNSRSATEANNHFGIKCKKDWSGLTITHTDDAPDECFRKYASVEESFMDHSSFLDNSARYQGLFKLEPTDYKGWAHGLKQAGYATNPTYAEQLIAIIDEYQLHKLDLGLDIPSKDLLAGNNKVVDRAEGAKIDVDQYVISINKIKDYYIYANNGSEFVLAKEGDNLSKLASQFIISEKRLRRFNDFSSSDKIQAGDMIYLKSKSKRSANGKLMHYVKDGETLHSISQAYGIRLRNLAKINRRTNDMPLVVGQQIRLM